ncbi:Mitochondrial substrate carrier family protein [Raphanus sativus]|nr:Mitochondrial substrate carrier family protein [Raphanus sativus]
MNLGTSEEESAQEIHIPADINWEMLDKSKFFVLGAALFSGVSGALYPAVLMKTRQQARFTLVGHEGLRGLYRGFGTSLMGTIPARALYMTALEVTKSNVGSAAVSLGFTEAKASAAANAVGGLTAAMAAQLVWTPVDVVSQRLMVQGKYGLGGIGCYVCKKGEESGNTVKPDSKTVMAVQGVSAAVAGSVSALITMPLDTIKTRLQVLDGEDGNGKRGPSIGQTVRNLVREGGWTACYRGLGPRCASMSMSATTMITTYEFLKRLSAKNHDGFYSKSY